MTNLRGNEFFGAHLLGIFLLGVRVGDGGDVGTHVGSKKQTKMPCTDGARMLNQ